MKKPSIKQLEKWHEENEHELIVEAVEAIPESKRDFDLIKLLARAYTNCGHYGKAYSLLAAWQAEGESDAMWNWRMGLSLYETGRRAEAVPYLEQAISLGDDDPETAYYLKMARKNAVDKGEAEARRRAAYVPRDPRQEPFKGFDFTDFWDDDDYALEKYVGAAASDKTFSEAEKSLGYKLPASYKWLMKQHNGGMPRNYLFPLSFPGKDEPDKVYIDGIRGVDSAKTYSLCGATGSRFIIDEWGYPDIGIAICDCPSGGHDMVFLDYRHCGKDGEPEVVHIDQESDYEITWLAGDFESFVRGLIQDDEDDEDDYYEKPEVIPEAYNFQDEKSGDFTRKVNIGDIPWRRLATCYGRAADFPAYFDALSGTIIADIDHAGDRIADNIEHQSTLWPATPFAMIFLVRTFLTSITDIKQEANRYRVVNLLDLFIEIAEVCKIGRETEHAKPLPVFEDMLEEKYLWPEEYDEDEDEARYEEEGGPFPDDLFYSFYYYSHEALQLCKDELQNYTCPDEEISGKIGHLISLLN